LSHRLLGGLLASEHPPPRLLQQLVHGRQPAQKVLGLRRAHGSTAAFMNREAGVSRLTICRGFTSSSKG
jgi:hypothetical protein